MDAILLPDQHPGQSPGQSPGQQPARHPHPSKEEVRAWMVRRCGTGAPPPPPDEIRRELGWTLSPDALEHAVGTTPANCFTLRPLILPAIFPAILPVMLAELAALTTIAWYCLACQASRGNSPPNT